MLHFTDGAVGLGNGHLAVVAVPVFAIFEKCKQKERVIR